LRNINNQKLSIAFFTKLLWEEDQIDELKTDTGYIKVSSPELTAFDFVYYHRKIGGINRVLHVLEDLAENMKSSNALRVAKTQKLPNIQRLGYLLETIGATTISNALLKFIPIEKLSKVPLSLAHKEGTAKVDNNWRIIVNTKLEF
jgi:hypothetical protein